MNVVRFVLYANNFSDLVLKQLVGGLQHILDTRKAKSDMEAFAAAMPLNDEEKAATKLESGMLKAVYLYRKRTGYGLRESKAVIEGYIESVKP